MPTVGILDHAQRATHSRRTTVDALQAKGCEIRIVDPFDVVFRWEAEGCTAWHADQQLDALDVCWVRRTRGAVPAVLDVVRYLDQIGVPCVDPIQAYINPLGKTGTLLKALGHIQLPPTAVVNSPAGFQDLEWADWPAVIKPLSGCQGRGVERIDNRLDMVTAAEPILESGDGVIVQGLLPIEREYRVTVVGREVVGVYSKQQHDPDVLARNLSAGGEFTAVDRPDLHETAVATAQRNHYDICGVDLAETADGIFLLEANRNPAIEPIAVDGIKPGQAVADFLTQAAEQGRLDGGTRQSAEPQSRSSH